MKAILRTLLEDPSICISVNMCIYKNVHSSSQNKINDDIEFAFEVHGTETRHTSFLERMLQRTYFSSS